jgi:hypothetical protein
MLQHIGRLRLELVHSVGDVFQSLVDLKSPIGISNNLGRGSGQKGAPGSKTDPERDGRPTWWLTRRSGSRGEQK